jgi:hypothetical protein
MEKHIFLKLRVYLIGRQECNIEVKETKENGK